MLKIQKQASVSFSSSLLSLQQRPQRKTKAWKHTGVTDIKAALSGSLTSQSKNSRQEGDAAAPVKVQLHYRLCFRYALPDSSRICKHWDRKALFFFSKDSKTYMSLWTQIVKKTKNKNREFFYFNEVRKTKNSWNLSTHHHYDRFHNKHETEVKMLEICSQIKK